MKSTLKKLILSKAKVKNLSTRTLAIEMGIQPSHLSEILSGKRKTSIEFLSKAAEYFGIPLIEVYAAAGVIDLDKDEYWIARFKEISAKDKKGKYPVTSRDT